MELFKQDPKGVVDIYLINLKTGEVTTRQSTYLYSLHHVNAFEEDNEVFVDLVTNRFETIWDGLKLRDMLNPPSERNLTKGSGSDLLRFRIGIHEDYVQIKNIADEDAKSPSLSLFTNHLEFPVINEMYRGRAYCVLYGWTAIQLSRQVGDNLKLPLSVIPSHQHRVDTLSPTPC